MKRIKKIPKWLRVTLICSIIICSIWGATYLIVNAKLDKIHRVHAESTISPEDEYFDDDTSLLTSSSPLPTVSSKVTSSSTPTVLPTSTIIPDADILYNKHISNILLIGQDKLPNEVRARSDSMILITINDTTDTIKMTSFMRDLYVQIPGYSNNKLNSAFAFGSTDLINETFKKNFGIQIDGNIIVDFTNFIDIIDVLGGVDITISKKEAAYLNKKGFDVSKGDIHMNGNLALAYSRIRKIDSDFCRTSRQRTVLCTLFDTFSEKSYIELYNLTDKIFPYITTNMSNSEILSYVKKLMDKDDIQTHRIPADNTYNSTYVGKMSVLIPDLDANRDLLKEWLY